MTERLAIEEVLIRYTRAIDTGEWDRLDEVFTEDAVLDYSPVGGPADAPAVVKPWIAQGLAGFDRYQHVIGQVSIELDGDEARATAYFTNPMVSVDPEGNEKLWEVGGYYRHELRRTAGGWRSTRLLDDVVWTRGF